MEDDTPGDEDGRPDSLLPYDLWTEDALRHVVVLALDHVARNGLPGQHHFFISFRTDAPGVAIPPRLSAQYPSEMTIVLQHQFWDLKVAENRRAFSVGLSFGGIPSTLEIPFAALTGFADPQVQFGLRFRTPDDGAANDAGAPDAPDTEQPADEPPPAEDTPSPEPQIVSLDAFRKRSPHKE